MKKRMLDGGIWANEKFAELPCMARLLQIGLINLADDQGRIKAHPSYLRSQLFPYDEDVTVGDIRKWLACIIANGTVISYEVDGKDYIQLVNWWDYQVLQYASPSDHPRPEGWLDRIRYNAKGSMTLTCNWVSPRGETPADTCGEDGKPLPSAAALPPRNPPGRPSKNPPGNPPGNPPTNTNNDHDQLMNNTNKDQTTTTRAPELTQPTAPTAIVDDFPLPSESISPKALIDDLRQRQFVYMDKNATVIAAQLIAEYGWERVMAAADTAATQHCQKIDSGDKGITAPLAYMRSILAGTMNDNGKSPTSRSTNNGTNAILDYAESRGMINGRDR